MSASVGIVASFSRAVLASPECAWHHQNTAFTRLTDVSPVSVNIFFTIFTNVFSPIAPIAPIAPTRMRRFRRLGALLLPVLTADGYVLQAV